jgi:Mn2+/Fe2+ NRAMP family transporter
MYYMGVLMLCICSHVCVCVCVCLLVYVCRVSMYREEGSDEDHSKSASEKHARLYSCESVRSIVTYMPCFSPPTSSVFYCCTHSIPSFILVVMVVVVCVLLFVCLFVCLFFTTRETKILCSLDHPNVIRLYEVLETSLSICIVMQYAAGGDLYSYIVNTPGQKVHYTAFLPVGVCFLASMNLCVCVCVCMCV